MLRRFGLRDRMLSLFPIDERNLLFLGFDRRLGGEMFNQNEGDVALGAAYMFAPIFRAWALTFGYADGYEQLTPREVDVLGGLLDGQSESEIAADLGLKPGSVHQVVLRVYSKFQVGGHAELTQLWLAMRG